MRFYQKWTGIRISDGKKSEEFCAFVPGNIQYDYGKYVGFGDPMYGENCKKYEALENDSWAYVTRLSYERKDSESVWFVSEGVDYKYDVLINNEKIYSYEGMFKPFELDVTDLITGDDELCVFIYPHPKREGAAEGHRDQADASCKPPVCYGWDWNPRLLISGMWQEAYIETRTADYIFKCEPSYSLNEAMDRATVSFDIECSTGCKVNFYDAEDNLLYSGDGKSFELENIKLWWCNGQGEPYLYKWTVENAGNKKSGTLGFRKVRLLRNIGTHDPAGFPKSRYPAPFTIELNGRRIFMKGSNFVNPDIFWGHIDEKRYEELVDLAVNANMNIFRLWGGASFCKKEFYDICDKKGIMVWQEFMLACNAYPNDDGYLSVLESEAVAMIKALRLHASVVLWSGGNELFNSWSGMSDQSLPLRLLGSLCYTYDKHTPYIMTSPLEGMGHGGYKFLDEREEWRDVLQIFRSASCTAYTEFGVPSITSYESLKKIIPSEDISEITEAPSWKLHHAIGAWRPESHACLETLKRYFGKEGTVEERIKQSEWLQSEGLKAIFEEARRQWPKCSAALNWCFNEPWITAANLSIVRYPAVPTPGYFAVKNALRPSLFSARIPRFDWRSGDRFTAEIWLLNDSNKEIFGSVEVILLIGDKEVPLLKWENATADARTNTEGASVCCTLPAVDADSITLILKADNGMENEYKLLYERKKTVYAPKGMNM